MESPKRGLFLFVGVLAISAIAGGLYGRPVRATGASAGDIQDSYRSFTKVLSIVEHNYATPVDTDKAVYDGAIPNMLRVLDPHSYFFDPKQYASFKEEQQGRYYGVGMTVAPRENFTYVVAPMFGSPAYKAGIRPGDTILKVDDKSCEGLDTGQVAELLKGPKGTQVKITLGREGWEKPIEVSVTRDEIPRPGVDFYTLVHPGIGYARVSAFNETTDADLATALKDLDVSKLDGMILDVRGNGGGLLQQAVGIGDMFLEKNQLVVSFHGRSAPERRFYAVRGNQGVTVPLVVLINGQSASASEIVAGAMQDHDRGLVVGETSFGKGLVQTQFPLSENTAMLLTVARYYTPSGRLIQRDYKNVSLYDYHYNPKPPRQPEVKLTDSGRQVFGQGGITPDIVVAAPKNNPFQETLIRRGVFYPFPQGVGDFTRSYLGEKPDISKNFTTDDAVIAELRAYLDKQHIRYSDDDIHSNIDWLKWRIQREVLTSVFGVNEGYKIELEHDPQLAEAVNAIPRAKALYENARKIVAQRQALSSPQIQ
jgi:carboxyl-terminal processing protease